MHQHKVIQIIVNCNTEKEAEKIGKKLLKERFIACFDILPRKKTVYYWPPGKNKTKSGKGCLLTGPTIHKHLAAIEQMVEKLHSDKVPFIGFTELTHVNKSYYNWLILELK